MPQWKLIEKQHKHQISDSKVKGNINPILQDVIMEPAKFKKRWL